MYGTRATDRRYCIELDKKNGKGCIREAKTHRTARFVSCIVPNVVLSTQCVRTIAYKVTCEPSQTLIEQWYVWIMVKRRLTQKKKEVVNHCQCHCRSFRAPNAIGAMHMTFPSLPLFLSRSLYSRTRTANRWILSLVVYHGDCVDYVFIFALTSPYRF